MALLRLGPAACKLAAEADRGLGDVCGPARAQEQHHALRPIDQLDKGRQLPHRRLRLPTLECGVEDPDRCRFTLDGADKGDYGSSKKGLRAIAVSDIENNLGAGRRPEQVFDYLKLPP